MRQQATFIPELEAELDSFSCEEDISRLLLFRVLAIEYPHRTGGGSSPADAANEIRNYLAALSLAALSLRRKEISLIMIQRVHARLSGRAEPTPFRNHSVAVRPNILGARMRLTGTAPWNVFPRMEEMLDNIYRNPALSRFERLAFGYFELIRTHPFEDGNGRLSRLLLTALIERAFRPGLILTITRVMRSDFRRYHNAIRSQDDDVYARWLSYVGGAVRTEFYAARRFGTAFARLDRDDRNTALRIVGQAIRNFQRGAGSATDFIFTSSDCSAKVGALLLGLMA